MPFDDKTRNRLQKFVSEARRVLSDEFTAQLQNDYGLDPLTGHIIPIEQLADDPRKETARQLRLTYEHYVASTPNAKAHEILGRIAREQAFTVLNRLGALRMCEARDLLVESIADGTNSRGFQLYQRLAGAAFGDTSDAYRQYLLSIFDEFAVDLGVLFDRFSPLGLLFPGEGALLELLALINDQEIAALWAEDETIGWLYQYFNSEAERKKMREESSAPRNSRELAVRNQFFTPRYVVEFLTDNTLGRLWYEMTRGETTLRDRCRYLVRWPTEIFLKPGESAPESAAGSEAQAGENLPQEELLRQPVHIPHRVLKDPREIRLLDPACGSMHFGLYAFDLFTVIYDEAWEIAHGLDDAAKSAESFAPFIIFAATFSDKAAFLREVPRLIVENNIHGIDIDPRAAQIAGLSLWLRAHRAWHQAGVKSAERPRITRSNLVCAEPMPGEKELLREFVEQQFPTGERPAFAFLLETVFDRMTLAGEAGSLLRIEEEIRAAIAEAKRLWKEGPKHEQVTMFPEIQAVGGRGDMRLDLSGITDEQFWQRAEQRIYDALEAYAEQAENGDGFQRRLFADDAAQGFAFIDLCRKRYDVSVMNPPFGAPSLPSESYIATAYPLAKNDIYGCFIEAALHRRYSGGLVGAITSRTWLFLPRRQDIRLGVIDASSRVHCLADLGHGVLDTAMVETCAFCLATPEKALPSTFIRLVDAPGESKEVLLRDALGNSSHERRFDVDQDRFKLLPGAPFAYWISDSLFDLLADASRFGDEWEIGPGLTTRDNDRFLRSPLEIPRSGLSSTWHWFAKGGAFSPYYFDTQLLLNYAEDGSQIKAWISSLGESVTTFIANQRFYFQPGFTYPRVGKGFNVRVLRAGHIFAEKGISIFSKAGGHPSLAALAFLNSSLIQELLLLMAPSRSWEKTFVASLPALRGDLDLLEASATKIVRLLTATLSQDTTSNLFWGFPIAAPLADAFNRIHLAQEEASETVRSEAEAVSVSIRKEFNCIGQEPDEFQNDPWEAAFVIGNAADYTAILVEYLLGIDFGRWDTRYATGERPVPELPDPFAHLPVCPPGMLQGDDGLPLSPEAGRRLRAEGRYPLDVAWDGVLVDDPEHPLDLERSVRAALAVLWGDRADELEHEVCSLLGVPTIREWFRRPTGFFSDHLQRYSKSRRQAPIYWPLSTTSGSYTLWIYYHRLDDQTLFACVNDFVEPKLRGVQSEMTALSGKSGRTSREEKQLEALHDFASELEAFRDELLRLTKLPWKPNLNDGVQITAAPLWKLFRLPKWQKTLKQTWQELENGDCDWAHLAYSIWPDRVREKCKTDKSLAIAHGLEELYVEPPKTAKKKGRRAKTTQVTEELEFD